MKSLPFILILSILGIPAFGQKVSRKKLLRKARYHFNTASYYKAAEKYNELLMLDSTNKVYLFETGLAWYHTGFEKVRALPFLLASQRFSKADTLPETYFFIAEIQLLLGDFEKAISNYTAYKTLIDKYGVQSDGKVKRSVPEEIDQKIQWCKNGMAAGKTNANIPLTLNFPGEFKKSPVKMLPLDSNVNSPFDDYSSILNSTDDLLYFTTRRKEGLKNYIDYFDVKHFEDIYVSSKKESGWGPCISLPGQVNSKKRHEATNFLSKDGNSMYIYQGVRTGTMFLTTLQNGSWSKPEPVKGAGLNSKHWETSLSFCISNDQVMYVVSDRPGGIGGRDIYQCKKQPDGSWGALENMGALINSRFDEDGPYISPDGKTLYFSSNGPASFGGFDVFRSDLQDGKWTAPRNLGISFNSTADDIYFHFSNTGKNAMLSSSRLHLGRSDMDIYAFSTDCINPEKIEVFGKYTGSGADGEVCVYFTKKGIEKVQKHIFHANSANLLYGPIVLETGADYIFTVETPLGKVQMEVNIPKTCTNNPYYQQLIYTSPADTSGDTLRGNIRVRNAFFDAALESEGTGDPLYDASLFVNTLNRSDPRYGFVDSIFVLKKPNKPPTAPSWFFTPVYFEFDRWVVKKDHLKELDQLVIRLKEHPELKIELQGHTDAKGSNSYNEKLSMRRVRMVAEYLYKQGVNKNQVNTVYYGEINPAFPNTSVQNRQKNRRVEILVTGGRQ